MTHVSTRFSWGLPALRLLDLRDADLAHRRGIPQDVNDVRRRALLFFIAARRAPSGLSLAARHSPRIGSGMQYSWRREGSECSSRSFPSVAPERRRPSSRPRGVRLVGRKEHWLDQRHAAARTRGHVGHEHDDPAIVALVGQQGQKFQIIGQDQHDRFRFHSSRTVVAAGKVAQDLPRDGMGPGQLATLCVSACKIDFHVGVIGVQF